MSNIKVIPTIFATNKKDWYQRFNKLLKVSKNLQIDIMDGKFVANKSLQIEDFPNIRIKNMKFEAHLMVVNPEEYLIPLKKKGFSKVIVHFEAFKGKSELDSFVSKVKEVKMDAYLANNPTTEFEDIVGYLHDFKGILFMGVNPGQEHQEFINDVYLKIKKLRNFSKDIKIQVDGGVNFEVAEKLSKLGVNYINSGSFVYKSKKPKETIKMLESFPKL